MSNKRIMEFDRVAKLAIPDTIKRRKALAVILGFAIGGYLPVHFGDDISPMTVFSDQFLLNVNKTVSYINENMIVDINSVVDSTKSIYVLRHRFVNGMPASEFANPEFDFLAIALGLSPIMSPEVYQIFKEYGTSCVKLLVEAQRMIHDLKAAKHISL